MLVQRAASIDACALKYQCSFLPIHTHIECCSRIHTHTNTLAKSLQFWNIRASANTRYKVWTAKRKRIKWTRETQFKKRRKKNRTSHARLIHASHALDTLRPLRTASHSHKHRKREARIHIHIYCMGRENHLNTHFQWWSASAMHITSFVFIWWPVDLRLTALS